MNHLPPAGADAWHLPRHAHIVVYRGGDTSGDPGGLLTVYDCGVAQAPPSAQVMGQLQMVTADSETRRTPTGSVVSLREPGLLVRDGNGWSIEPVDE